MQINTSSFTHSSFNINQAQATERAQELKPAQEIASRPEPEFSKPYKNADDLLGALDNHAQAQIVHNAIVKAQEAQANGADNDALKGILDNASFNGQKLIDSQSLLDTNASKTAQNLAEAKDMAASSEKKAAEQINELASGFAASANTNVGSDLSSQPSAEFARAQNQSVQNLASLLS